MDLTTCSDAELAKLIAAMRSVESADNVDYPEAINAAQAEVDEHQHAWSVASEHLIKLRATTVPRWRRADLTRHTREIAATRDDVAKAYELTGLAHKRLAALESAASDARVAMVANAETIATGQAALAEQSRRTAEAATKAKAVAAAKAAEAAAAPDAASKPVNPTPTGGPRPAKAPAERTKASDEPSAASAPAAAPGQAKPKPKRSPTSATRKR